jgi:predicted aldo/keto reductase-like oxidoreductase
MNRRKFIETSMAGLVGLSVLKPESLRAELSMLNAAKIDAVELGKTGLKVSRIALGTGTIGMNKSSNQTRLGIEKFTALVKHCYSCGVRFFDMADGYGSHPYIGRALKSLEIERKKVTLMTKMWTFPDGTPQAKDADKTLQKYLQEIETNYIDILLMHCMVEGNWNENRKYYMEAFSKAKQSGLVKAVGVSCHNFDALRKAASDPWVDVILARINPFQTLMDGTPEEVNAVLGEAKSNGKGIIGMKIFGEGKHIKDDERQRSLEFAMKTANIHGITLGLESESQVDDAIKRIKSILK